MLGSLVAWGPFLLAIMSRVFGALSAFLFFERHLVGTAPPVLQSFVFYGALVFLGQALVRTIVSSLTAGPTPDTRVTVEGGAFLAGTVSWVAAGMRGWREAMEDAHVAELLDASVFSNTVLFAVLDGHGGKDVSALASQLLAREVVACGREQLRLNGKAVAAGDVKAVAAPDLQQSLEMALPRLDLRLRRGCFGMGALVPSVMHPFHTMGSTACVVAVDIEGREVLCASAGDSRALLIRNGKAIALSDDHKPENAGERTRINNAGGQVIKVGPCHRVDGNLNLSRALGDFYLKSNAGLPPEKQKVIANPDSMRSRFQGGSSEILAVACDGLFEKRSNQDIANLIWQRHQRGMAMEQIAKEVLLACCARGSCGRPIEEGTDNESLILVKLPTASANGGCNGDAAAPVEAQGADADGHAAKSAAAFRPGQEVEIHGLESEAGQVLNGLAGVIEEAAAVGAATKPVRYAVRLVGSGEMKSLKGDNLKVR